MSTRKEKGAERGSRSSSSRKRKISQVYENQTIPSQYAKKNNTSTRFSSLVSSYAKKASILESRIKDKTHPWESVKCGVKIKMVKIPGKGLGVVANQFIKRGDFVCDYWGDLITEEEAFRREEEEERAAGGKPTISYMFYFTHSGKKLCIDSPSPYTPEDLDRRRFPEDGIDDKYIARYLNHSRKGNLSPRKIIDKNKKPHIVLFANRDIDPDEELTFDYGERREEILKIFPWLKE